MSQNQSKLFSVLDKNLNLISTNLLTENRKDTLNTLIDFIQSKIDVQEAIRINFICTHNSRRSHLSQIWAQTMASYFKIENVSCYSGGTEASALFPMVIQTLKQQGFQIQKLSEGSNPVFAIKFSKNELPIIGFSKKLDDDFNPKSKFAAVMTCNSANEACPFVPGAETRIPITFEDPKLFDGTPQQDEKYYERSLQIASEMYYVFSKIKA